MGSLFVFLIISNSFYCIGQNYEVIPIGVQQITFEAELDLIYLKVDSSSNSTSGLTYILQKEIAKSDSTSCSFNPMGYSHFGDEILDNDSVIEFVFDLESFRLYRRADSVKQIVFGDSLLTTFLGMAYDTLYNGMLDSIETYEVKCLSANSLNCFNNAFVVISKNFGLIEFPSFFKRLSPILYAKNYTKLNRIEQEPMRFGDVYDFNVGDEFHYRKTKSLNIFNSVREEEYSNILILEKTIDTISNKLIYKALFKATKFELAPTPVATTIIDTVFLEYQNMNQVIWDGYSYVLPIHQGIWLGDLGVQGVNHVMVLNDDNYYRSSLNCMTFGTLDPKSEKVTYRRGLGEVKYEYSHLESGFNDEILRDLIYYKKGGTSVGSPHFISIDEIAIEAEVRVFPNPAKDEAAIKNCQACNEALLYSITGKLLKKIQLDGVEKIDLSQCENGIYTLVIKSDSLIMTRKLIVQK